jgi:hypothetical protein
LIIDTINQETTLSPIHKKKQYSDQKFDYSALVASIRFLSNF